MRNFQILIVSAVKTCKQCPQIASVSPDSTFMWTPQNLPLLFKMHELWSLDSQVTKVVATMHILGPKCIKFDFRWDCMRLRTRLRSLQRSSRSLVVLKGSTSKGRRRKRGGKKKGAGKGKGKGKGRHRRGTPQIFT